MSSEMAGCSSRKRPERRKLLADKKGAKKTRAQMAQATQNCVGTIPKCDSTNGTNSTKQFQNVPTRDGTKRGALEPRTRMPRSLPQSWAPDGRPTEGRPQGGDALVRGGGGGAERRREQGGRRAPRGGPPRGRGRGRAPPTQNCVALSPRGGLRGRAKVRRAPRHTHVPAKKAQPLVVPWPRPQRQAALASPSPPRPRP